MAVGKHDGRGGVDRRPALAEGERLSDKSAVEVWDGSRLVARVKPGNAALNAQDSYSL